MVLCFGSLEMLQERSEPQLTEMSEKRGSWGQVQGVNTGQAAAACCSPHCKSHGDS